MSMYQYYRSPKGKYLYQNNDIFSENVDISMYFVAIPVIVYPYHSPRDIMP